MNDLTNVNEDREVSEFISNIGNIVIVDQDGYSRVMDVAKKVKSKIKEFEERRLEMTRPIDETKASIIKLFEGPIQRLKDFEIKAKSALQKFIDEQEEIRRQEQARRDEIARREREKIEQEAAKKREQEEALRKEQEAAQKRAREAQNEEERKKAEKEAANAKAKAQAAADQAEVKSIMAQSVESAPVVEKVKTQGLNKVPVYNVVVENKENFVRYCLESNRLEFLEVNESLIKTHYKASKETREFAGIRIDKTYSTRINSGRKR